MLARLDRAQRHRRPLSDDFLAPTANVRRKTVRAFLAERVADCTVFRDVITRTAPRQLAKDGLEHVHCDGGDAPKPTTEHVAAAGAAPRLTGDSSSPVVRRDSRVCAC